MQEHPAITRLARYRLERNLSYTQLAAEMAAAGYPVRARALHWAITGRLKKSPVDRTLYRIELFVSQVIDRKTPRRARPSLA